MLCKKKNNRIEGVPVYCKKSSLHLSGRNNKIIFGKNCNIVNCRIKLYGNSTLVLGDDCYFENTLIMLRDLRSPFRQQYRSLQSHGNFNRKLVA